MDAPDDRDVKLQRASADLIKEFETKLPFLLWKTPATAENGRIDGKRSAHRWTQDAKTDRLIELLERFQEWPQLLDPHLQKFLPSIIDAFLDYLIRQSDIHQHRQASANAKRKYRLSPLPRAICRLLYVFCKVRGVKVISGFLNNEPKYLEPMLLAFIAWDEDDGGSGNGGGPSSGAITGHQASPMIWEERYVMLLWLSHLLLAPFDLASISSEVVPVPFENLELLEPLSPALPQITRSILSICLRYVIVPGKEREAATTLLARLALRPDMQKLGLLRQLVEWSLSVFEVQPGKESPSVYTCIGVSGFIARLFATGQVEDLTPLAVSVFQVFHRITVQESAFFKGIRSSASARKLFIKILRHITCLALSSDGKIGSRIDEDQVSGMLEDSIDYFLSALADKDTPVRFAASKALSVVTLKLGPVMAAEVVEAVLGSLKEDVLYETRDGRLRAAVEMRSSEIKSSTPVLNAVDPLRWQGLMLTLAHLLFRRSPPPDQLPEILDALISGLDFEQRMSTGTSLGTGVRDAACFGVWALSRKYSSEELRLVDGQMHSRSGDRSDIGALQMLAIELVASGCLDPSGNIRRGSSAALQELIGRHPDTILEGIPLVQVVDYHAIARRSRAMIDVSKGAADLGEIYWDSLLNSLLKWRGVGSPDAESRRVASSAIGKLSATSYGTMQIVLQRLLRRLHDCPPQAIELRHGYLLSLGCLVDEFHKLRETSSSNRETETYKNVSHQIKSLWSIFEEISLLDPSRKKEFTSQAFRPELTAEACSFLIASLGNDCPVDLQPAEDTLQGIVEILTLCLGRGEDIPIQNSSQAVASIFPLFKPEKQASLIKQWFADLAAAKKSPSGKAQIAALGFIFKYYEPLSLPGIEDPVKDVTLKLVEHAAVDEPIEKRVMAVRSLVAGTLRFMNGPIKNEYQSIFFDSIVDFLNDYTTDQRGDIGTLIRLEGINAVQAVLDGWPVDTMLDPELSKFGETYANKMKSLVRMVARLAGEKLDKVRFQAWKCLERVWERSTDFPPLKRKYDFMSQVSSSEYFTQLLTLLQVDWLRVEVLKGFMTSTGAGADNLICGSRHGLVKYLTSKLPESPSSSTQRISRTTLLTDLHNLIDENLHDDRYVVPAMEALAFLLSENFAASSPSDCTFSPRKAFLSVQKAQFKSSNVLKIEAAIKVYAALLDDTTISNDVLKKLLALLLHPYPKIRNTAADVLSMHLDSSLIAHIDWSSSQKQLKPEVDGLRKLKGFA